MEMTLVDAWVEEDGDRRWWRSTCSHAMTISLPSSRRFRPRAFQDDHLLRLQSVQVISQDVGNIDTSRIASLKEIHENLPLLAFSFITGA
ncbi:hypothetical protein M6B38_311145 [Iris pallida]|uniref:Uncharacterized protein n=1 Tax=Iris pallida TaxID=29817 RepID=A0AAX6HH84_IRIPA|nr:hypothetical protein M6B38_311145 [Iris pallida]